MGVEAYSRELSLTSGELLEGRETVSHFLSNILARGEIF